MSVGSHSFDNLTAEEKRAALKRLLGERVRKPRFAPVSFAQERLWVLEQLTPGSAVYCETGAVRLKAALEPSLLEHLLNQVVRRHEALRTTFTVEDGKPVQRIASALHVPVRLTELAGATEEERVAEVRQLAAEQSRTPFDLEGGPLLRVNLYRIALRDHVLVVTLHHIIADGWSIGVLIRELIALYLARVAGHPAALPELPLQYADYARWQREWLAGETLESQLEYWRAQLAGAPVLELPSDRPRPPVRTFSGASRRIELNEQLTAGLRELCRREGVTLFMTLLAAFQTLLHRYSGGREQDIVVGSPVAGRKRRELEPLIGFFVNMLPLRTDLAGDPTFRELLARVRRTCLAAYEHEDIPFEKIVDELVPGRNLRHAPLFQVVFALHRNVLEIEDVNGITVRPLDLTNGTAKYDLTLFLWEGSRKLTGKLEYNTDLFDAATVDRLAGHLTVLLGSIIADPDCRLGALELIGADERRRALDTGRPRRSEPAPVWCLHRRFEQQAARVPDAIALRAEGRSWTYAELNRRANRLAQRLKLEQVGPEVPVALVLERTPEMVVAVLAVLKAGGAYVPIDPRYPADRVRFILEDSRARVVLAARDTAERVPATEATRTLVLDDLGFEEEGEGADENLALEVPPEALAYIIYTSGSTGTPKGVMVTHANVARLFEATEPSFGFGPDDVWTLFHSYAFDFSVWELWGALLYGGRLVIVPYWVSRSPEDFLGLLHEEGVTVLNQTPSAFRQLIAADAAGPARGTGELCWVIFGGEALDFSMLGSWYEAHGDRRPRLVNMYGITETTVHVTYRPLEWADARRPSSAIGQPLDDLGLYILDRELAPVPDGVLGELHVAGAGLARGYLGRPELTAERFVPDPFSGAPGARMYRTGDLARRRADGEIDYLGRIDHQVKIRGHRIELGEIEAAIAEHPAVAQAIVLLRDDGPGEIRLVAYVVARQTAPDPGELRMHLQAKLPDYMVPASFVMLEALPLTPNGKLDRAALPAPDASRPALARAYVPPSTAIERELAAIWSSVLGVERVGVHDNFFELGGDSILAIQVISRASQAGLRVTARQLFQHQTVAELSRVVGRGEVVEAEQGEVRGEVPAQAITRWWLGRACPQASHYNQSVLLELRERLEPELLERALGTLLVHHDALRLRLERGEGGSVRQWLAAAEGSASGVFERVDLSGLEAGTRRAALEQRAGELQSSLDLVRGPIVRGALFETGEAGRPQRLLLVIHHVAVDGVSWRILLEDLFVAYGQLAQGRGRVELAAKTTSYKRWCERLVEHASSAEVRGELEYWRGVVAGGVLPVPYDHVRGANTVGSSRTVEVRLGASQTAALLQSVPSAYRTRIDEVLLAALARTLGEWTGGSEVLVDLEGHGREERFAELDVSRTVGWFTTLYPVRLSVESSAGAGARLKSSKEQLRAVPGRGLGYGLLRWVGGETELRSGAEVSFNYLGRFEGLLPVGGAVGLAEESTGAVQSPAGERSHVLEVTGGVEGGSLRLAWTYSENLHERATIEKWASRYVEELEGLIEHCLDPEAGGVTPSDFPLSGLDQSVLDRVVGRDRGVEDLYPLSPLQSGLLFHTLYAPDSGVYFEQIGCTFAGELDGGAFRSAWQSAVDRHAILRTSFQWESVGEPLQVVRRTVELPWREEDWRDVESSEQQARLERLLEEDRRAGFDLTRAPLMRLMLIRLSERSWRLVWSHHHLLLDGWSLPLLLKEVMLDYEALVSGHRLPAEPVRPYRDYIAWLAQQDRAAAQEFWRRTLAGVSAPTPLGIASSSMGAEPAWDEKRMRLEAAEAAELEQFARSHQLTLNTLVQGAWALLLRHYSGEEDVLFGVTVSGRSAALPGIEAMLGLFINTLPARVAVPEHASLVPWLQQVQEQQAVVRQYEHSSLVEVHGASDVPRGTPLFESLLVFENYPLDEMLEGSGERLKVSDVRYRERTNYPLTLIAAPGKGLSLRLIYDGRRFEPRAAERVLEHLRTLLGAMRACPGARLGELSLLDEATRSRILDDWNATDVDRTPPACIHELFAAQVRRTPQAIAVRCGDEALSYAELARRSSGLAARLRALGVGPDVPVAVCLERRPSLIAALLGVLEAGGAYVPLDPSYPAARLTYMLEDSAAPVLVTETRLVDRVGSCTAQLVLVDEELALTARPAARAVRPENLAYVIYTSGSTGRPKGVAIAHRSTVELLRWASGVWSAEELSGVLAGTSVCFDLSVFEIFLPLTRGGTVILAADTLGLAELAEAGVTLVNTVPSAIEALLREGALPESVVTVNLAGEPLRTPLVSRLYEHGVRRVYDLYGPSEDTTYSTWALREPEGPETIGGPIAGTRAYVLDRWMRPVPPGIPGELYLGGAGLARGYLGRPELTAERFVPDSLSGRMGARLYRTGDICRWRDDGRLEFGGRADRQVKLRGHRIELGEVEAALREIAGVSDAVALVREIAPGDSRLVAYVVPEPGATVEASELHARLAARLPDPMLPSFYETLEALPLLPNGKIDRGALPAPGARRLARGEHVAPRNETERRLVELWSEVLGVERERVGVEDSFFELGGHSLLATQLVSRVREAFEVELPLRALFEASTVAGLAAAIERAARGRRMPAIEPVPRGGPLEVSYAQERLWVQDRLAPGDASYNMPVAVRLRGALDTAAMRRAFEAIVLRHEALRTTFEDRDGRPVQLVHDLAEAAVPLVDLSGLPETQRFDEARRRAREAARQPFDLARGPLLRAHLWRLAPDDHVLSVTMHHIVSDGWSLGVLVGEMAALYETFAAGREAAWPALPVQYADYAAWQRRWLEGAVLDEQLGYWKRQLEGLAMLELPADRPRPLSRSGGGASHAFRIPGPLAARIKEFSDGVGATPFMSLLAAFQVVLHAASGQRDIAIGSDVAGRTQQATEGLIGFFVNQIVVRTRVDGGLTFLELLARVRETTLEAYEHQDLPFDRLVAALNPPRRPGRLPLFDVKLVLQNAPLPRLAPAGLRFEAVDLALGTAKFDLLVNLWDTGSGLEGDATYSTDLFDAARVTHLLERFEEVLRHVVDAPATSIDELVRLMDTADEQRRATRRGQRRRANLERLKSLKQAAPGASGLGGENRREA